EHEGSADRCESNPTHLDAFGQRGKTQREGAVRKWTQDAADERTRLRSLQRAQRRLNLLGRCRPDCDLENAIRTATGNERSERSEDRSNRCSKQLSNGRKCKCGGCTELCENATRERQKQNRSECARDAVVVTEERRDLRRITVRTITRGGHELKVHE